MQDIANIKSHVTVRSYSLEATLTYHVFKVLTIRLLFVDINI